MVDVEIFDSAEAVATAAASAFADILQTNPAARVLVATGNTPMGMYADLARRVSSGELDTSQLIAVQLDEYLGLQEDDPRSLFGWMHRSFVDPLRIDPGRVVRLDATPAASEATCAAFDQQIEEGGGIDLAILGLGPNGHLGFNEPPSPADAPTRIVQLTPESLASNADYWNEGETVPHHAVTVGMSTILAARTIFLLVTGVHKAEILRRTLDQPNNPDVPSSLLRHAGDVRIFADADAASSLAQSES